MRPLRALALALLCLTALTPLVVAPGMFFPFITGKALLFRSLVELALLGWIASEVTGR
jgi:hypothetical protein